MFAKLSVILMPIYLRVFTYKYSILFNISGGIFTFLGYQFQLSSLCYVFLCIYQNRCENRVFSYPDRILVGNRDFQVKSGESRRDRDGWTF